jgi:hypothetical protein
VVVRVVLTPGLDGVAVRGDEHGVVAVVVTHRVPLDAQVVDVLAQGHLLGHVPIPARCRRAVTPFVVVVTAWPPATKESAICVARARYAATVPRATTSMDNGLLTTAAGGPVAAPTGS